MALQQQKVAGKIVTAQEFLLTKGRAMTLQLRGTWLLALTEHIPPELLPNLFPFVDDLLAHVPSVVESLDPPPRPGGSDTPVPDGASIAAEIIEDPAWRALDHGHFDGLHEATADEPEFDLDGNPITPHQEDPWGPGLPKHGDEGAGAAET